MTNKDRILNTFEGKYVDKMPWAPRLKLWYNAHKKQGTLPDKYQGLGLKEVEKILGTAAGSTARLRFICRQYSDKGHIIKSMLQSVKVDIKTVGNKRNFIYKTPLGTVTETYIINYEAIEKGLPNQEYLIEHMLKEDKDYEIIEYIYQDFNFIPTYDDYKTFERELGEHGVPIVSLHLDPMYLIMQDLIGFNKFFYEFNDNKKRVERLYLTLCEKFKELQELAINSTAKIFISAAHYDSKMISPYFYNEYFKSYLKPFAEKLKKRNKFLGFHADADCKGLLSNLLDTGIEYMDCFVTAPLSTVTLQEAINIWKDKVVIYGGIPSDVLVPFTYSRDRFEDYLIELFETIKDNKCRIILGVADNVMPEADISRIEHISSMVNSS